MRSPFSFVGMVMAPSWRLSFQRDTRNASVVSVPGVTLKRLPFSGAMTVPTPFPGKRTLLTLSGFPLLTIGALYGNAQSRARTAPPHPPCATRALRPVGSLVLITPPIAPTDMVMALAPTPCAPRVPESPRATPYRFTDVGTWGQSAPMGKRLRAIYRGCHLVPVVANLGALWRSPISTHCPHDPPSGDGGCLGGFLHPLRARRSRPAITRSLGRARPLLSQGSHCPTAYSSRHKGASSVGGRSL